ncbi:MAG: hypothetical protein DK306_001155 [Chloroflexi bacterium]|nr:MAG: hypothetical protein DK306_001155 [Chloroflexota bacterium]
MSTIQQAPAISLVAASAPARSTSPSGEAAASPAVATPGGDGFPQQLAAANVAQAPADGLTAQQADPSAPPLPPPPPPPPIPTDTPTAGDAPIGDTSGGANVQPVGEPEPPDSGFDGAGASAPTGTPAPAATGGLLASLGLSPGIQRMIRHARQFVPANASLHIFSTAPGAFRGKFVVPQDGVVNATPTAPFVAPPRVVPTDGPAVPTDTPLPPPPPAAPPAPDGSALPPPPPPPPIPPDEIILPNDQADPTDPAPAPSAASREILPDRQLVITALSAYRTATTGAAGPLTVPLPLDNRDD